MNRLRDELRRKGRLPPLVDVSELELAGEGSPLEEAIGREAAARYVAALGRLEPEEREAIIGRVEMEYSVRGAGGRARQADARCRAQGGAPGVVAPGRRDEVVNMEPLLDELADAILDGTPIDWTAVDAPESPIEKRARHAAEDAGGAATDAAGQRAAARPDERELGPPAPAGTHRSRCARRRVSRLGHAARSRGRAEAAPAGRRWPESVGTRRSFTKGVCWRASGIPTSSPSMAPNGSTAALASGWSSSRAGRSSSGSRMAGGSRRRRSLGSASSCVTRSRRSTRRACCTVTSRRRTSCSRKAAGWC